MKNPSARCWILPYKLLVREVPEAPQTIQATVIALDWPPELRDKTNLLKIDTTHLITSQRNKIVGGGAEGIPSTGLPSCESCELR